MRQKQQPDELLRLVRSMACSGKFKDLLEIEAALILQGRGEERGQLRDPKNLRDLMRCAHGPIHVNRAALVKSPCLKFRCPMGLTLPSCA